MNHAFARAPHRSGKKLNIMIIHDGLKEAGFTGAPFITEPGKTRAME